MPSQQFWSLDITARAKAAGAKAKPGDPLKVSLVPAGTPVKGANAVIGSLKLVKI